MTAVDNETTHWTCQDFVIVVFDECSARNLFSTSWAKLDANRTEALIYFGARKASWDLVQPPSTMRKQLKGTDDKGFLRACNKLSPVLRRLDDELLNAIKRVLSEQWRDRSVTARNFRQMLRSADRSETRELVGIVPKFVRSFNCFVPIWIPTAILPIHNRSCLIAIAGSLYQDVLRWNIAMGKANLSLSSWPHRPNTFGVGLD